MRTELLEIHTGGRVLSDVTPAAQRFVAGVDGGLLNVFAPHATAAIVIMELGAGSDDDFEALVQRILPRDDRYRHRHGSPGHGADHLLTPLLGASVTVPVVDGTLALGTWQSIVLVDTNPDNPDRSVRLSVLAETA